MRGAAAPLGDRDEGRAGQRLITSGATTAVVERELVGRLAVGAVVSIAGGAATWWWARRAGRPQLRDFGRQNVIWGVVDGGIAVIGRATSARLSGSRTPAEHARRLRAITAVNAVADLGYVAGGLRLVRTGRSGGGWAMVIQGLFLLWLDSLYTKRFHDLGAASEH